MHDTMNLNDEPIQAHSAQNRRGEEMSQLDLTSIHIS